jgi:hypothetical protein
VSVYRLCLFTLKNFYFCHNYNNVHYSVFFFESACSIRVVNNHVIFEMDLSLQRLQYPVIIEIHFCYKCISNRYVKITKGMYKKFCLCCVLELFSMLPNMSQLTYSSTVTVSQNVCAMCSI